MLKIGSVIDGKYKILNAIGHGGMSNVYLAINEKGKQAMGSQGSPKIGQQGF